MITGKPFSLEGKLALVTGSSRGIGRGVALGLARSGADIVVNYRVNAEAAQKTVAEIEAMGRRAVAIQANVAEPEAVAAMFNAIQGQFGGLDILVLNAGTGRRTTALDTTPKALNSVLSVNLLGSWQCAQGTVPLMKARGGGRMVFISTPGTEHVFPYYATVATSRAALDALMRYMAVELAPDNIVVNAVRPGVVLTESLEYQAPPDYIQRAISITPLRRAVRPEEVGYVIAFLCSEEATMICGQIIDLDGGLFLPGLG
ncbi:MAG: SDR family oxidoreductase [Chloroflexi bacterium]|nr:SDR family oxidoreductase [Chloroflexota bacterium]